MGEPCSLCILHRFFAQEFKLSFPPGTFALELLSAAEAKVLQDALLIEWCGTHGMFHCTGNPIEAIRWLAELRD
jgi:hypothetical protein